MVPDNKYSRTSLFVVYPKIIRFTYLAQEIKIFGIMDNFENTNIANLELVSHEIQGNEIL